MAGSECLFDHESKHRSQVDVRHDKKKLLFVNEREKKRIRFVLVHSKVRKVLKRFNLRARDAGFLPFLPLFSDGDCF